MKSCISIDGDTILDKNYNRDDSSNGESLYSYQLNCTYVHVAYEEAGVRIVGSGGGSSPAAVNVGVVVVGSALKQSQYRLVQ